MINKGYPPLVNKNINSDDLDIECNRDCRWYTQFSGLVIPTQCSFNACYQHGH